MRESAQITHDEFVNHSTKKKPWADAACAVLEGRGVRCWIAPRDIIPGTEWGAAIIGGLDDCRVVVLIFSASGTVSGSDPSPPAGRRRLVNRRADQPRSGVGGAA
jgi:hypothetical protein